MAYVNTHKENKKKTLSYRITPYRHTNGKTHGIKNHFIFQASRVRTRYFVSKCVISQHCRLPTLYTIRYELINES